MSIILLTCFCICNSISFEQFPKGVFTSIICISSFDRYFQSAFQIPLLFEMLPFSQTKFPYTNDLFLIMHEKGDNEGLQYNKGINFVIWDKGINM